MTALRFLGVLAFVAGGVVLARSGFEGSAYKVLKLERVASSPLAQADCQMCHVNARGDAPWNNFGLAVGFWRGKKQSITDAIYSAVRYGGDTDRDGYPDVIERMVGTNPASRDDKPSEKLADLQKRYDQNYKLEADNDADGYPDALEVLVGTLPGDANSRPSQDKASLEQQLEALGGVKFFAPKYLGLSYIFISNQEVIDGQIFTRVPPHQARFCPRATRDSRRRPC